MTYDKTRLSCIDQISHDPDNNIPSISNIYFSKRMSPPIRNEGFGSQGLFTIEFAVYTAHVYAVLLTLFKICLEPVHSHPASGLLDVMFSKFDKRWLLWSECWVWISKLHAITNLVSTAFHALDPSGCCNKARPLFWFCLKSTSDPAVNSCCALNSLRSLTAADVWMCLAWEQDVDSAFCWPSLCSGVFDNDLVVDEEARPPLPATKTTQCFLSRN